MATGLRHDAFMRATARHGAQGARARTAAVTRRSPMAARPGGYGQAGYAGSPRRPSRLQQALFALLGSQAWGSGTPPSGTTM